jgi:hypothetical protein
MRPDHRQHLGSPVNVLVHVPLLGVLPPAQSLPSARHEAAVDLIVTEAGDGSLGA